MNIPKDKPRARSNSEKCGSYTPVSRLSDDAVDPGGTLEIEIFITGYGDIRNPKLAFYFSPSLIDHTKSICYFDIGKKKDGSFFWGPSKHSVDETGTIINFTGGVSPDDGNWLEPTNFFDLDDSDSSPLSTESKLGGAAPVRLSLVMNNRARAGSHNIPFVLSYFDGERWQTSSHTVTVQVRNSLQRYAAVPWVLGVVAGL